jgi:transcriptional regulator with GAF, ATPase, and Fis domain
MIGLLACIRGQPTCKGNALLLFFLQGGALGLQLADKLEISSLLLSSTVRTLEEMERTQIFKTLSEIRWRIDGKDGAAAILGLHASTLRARMHKLGIVRPETREPD